ncbi:protein FAF-like, chloroplastic-like [Dorcoceras hygrometricum]|uniref:Protein FAF-like, chloroplastic-like n=1 Tax=Dorcoceras hygrometricum TaxID=472368 RepID=A0A2Z7AHR3_9LAMI|nr:protein FAF-like, chloroplastic-like [Dorcoceras hygrometricum]
MSVSKSLCHLSTSVLSVQQVEEKEPMKQGIVTILGSDPERNYKGSSLRRTLSADMSSQKWLSQNGFFLPVKKVFSSEEVAVVPDHDSSSSESEEEFEQNPTQDDVWRSIQYQKKVLKQEETSVWGTILTQKSETSATRNVLPPPYIHPLVKRSASAMNERSLRICTEGLGSETGFDEFCSNPCSETLTNGNDDKEERERAVQEAGRIKAVDPFEDLRIVKYKSSPTQPIPPPLSSISGGEGSPSLYMHAYRRNGRLVLEAVSVPQRKSFHAEREDGRLVLTLIDRLHTQENEAENRGQEFEKVFDDMEEDGGSVEEGELDEEAEEEEVMTERFELSMYENGSVQKSGLLMKKFMGIGNKNPNFCHEFNKSAKLMGEELTIPQSLPPRPPSVSRLIPSPSPPPSVPAATTFNAYEYFRRNMTGTTQATVLKNYMINGANQEMSVKKGNKIGCFVPNLRGCNKEPRRSLLLWEPYCIATS